MNKIIPSVIEDNEEYYIHIEEYKKVKELEEHYKHLYSELKKQKDDVVKYIKEAMYSDSFTELPSGEITDIGYCIPAFEDILRMLGEIERLNKLKQG